MAEAAVSSPVNLRVVTTGLEHPEGPIALADGSLLLVEIRPATLRRVRPDGRNEVVAEFEGGPNGAAIGPDGAVYICNNGGFNWHLVDGHWLPFDPETRIMTRPDFEGGWIERFDLATGEKTILYTGCDGQRLRGPNDIVFDSHGGFWFTDFGKHRPDDIDRGAIFYARADGSGIRRAPCPVLGPNGIGLSPDEDRLYVAETPTGRVVAFDLDGPGLASANPKVLCATKDRLDSLAVEADGTIVVAALPLGLLVVSPDTGDFEYVQLGDTATTNVCFGGDDLRTAYATCNGAGTLVAMDWPRPGLALPY